MLSALYFWRLLWPYVVTALISASAAWHVQGLNVRSAKLEFSEYKTEQQRLTNQANEAQLQRQAQTAREYQTQLSKLENDHEIYRRCVAAGKCGAVRVPVMAGCGVAGRLSSGAVLDENRPGAVPAAGGTAPEVSPDLLTDFARCVLQINMLQADIEGQPGYR